MSLKELRKDVQKYVTPEVVKQVFFYCDNSNQNGLLVDEVDLLEFSERLVAVIGKDIAKAERMECIKFIENLNKDVARALRDRREFL
jgi:hypothetical protein